MSSKFSVGEYICLSTLRLFIIECRSHFPSPGTFCEALLMVEACTKSIICPNKQLDPLAKFTPKGNLLESETYIGGKVECLESGVYRSDIEYKFDMTPGGFQGLIDNVDRDMTFALEVEGSIDRNKVTNYDEVR